MKITEVNLTPVHPKGGLVAFASCVLDGNIYLSSIAVYVRPSGTYRLLYPAKKVGAINMDIFHPINRAASKEIEAAIIQKCNEVFDVKSYEVSRNGHGQTSLLLR